MNSPDLTEWSKLIGRIREYAKTHARRHMVLLDAHVPSGGMVINGVSLLDFNSFPLRIKEIEATPLEGELQVGQASDSFQYASVNISLPSETPLPQLELRRDSG